MRPMLVRCAASLRGAWRSCGAASSSDRGLRQDSGRNVVVFRVFQAPALATHFGGEVCDLALPPLVFAVVLWARLAKTGAGLGDAFCVRFWRAGAMFPISCCISNVENALQHLPLFFKQEGKKISSQQQNAFSSQVVVSVFWSSLKIRRIPRSDPVDITALP
jgi:hypothetical protein